MLAQMLVCMQLWFTVVCWKPQCDWNAQRELMKATAKPRRTVRWACC